MTDKNEIIELLLKEGSITEEMIQTARVETQKTGLSLPKALEKLGFVSDKDILKVRAGALGIPYMDLSDYIIDTSLVDVVPKEVAKRFKAVPLFKIGNTLTIGMVDPQDIVALDQIRRVSKMEMVEPVLISDKSIQMVLDSYYSDVEETFDAVIDSINQQKMAEAEDKGLTEAAEEAPIVKLVNVMIMEAVRDKASDIHVEPEEEGVRLRYRVDGILREIKILPKNLQSPVISRIKILSKMDISENRKPQDGRIKLKIENKDLDVRVSTFPTVHGENVVMRLLDKSSVLLGLQEIGLSPQDLEEFNKLIHRPNGIVLVTGPTGSGKTTTLYTALTAISSIERNIVTVEDPVEYELPLIRQTQVNPKAGITFANGLRSILRQDPDIIMVGEIRDKETADVAIQAALTGHLVFATFHTNDAASALTRLIDMGIEPFLISSAVIGVVAQRLVRLICEKCKEGYAPEEDLLREMGIDPGRQLFRGRGCPRCNETGLAGRTGIFEVLSIRSEIRKMIDEKRSADEIKKKTNELGMRTLRQDGLEKILSGQTICEEVLRVTEVEG